MEYYPRKAHGNPLEIFLFLVRYTEAFHLLPKLQKWGLKNKASTYRLNTALGTRVTRVAPCTTARGPNLPVILFASWFLFFLKARFKIHHSCT